jgi:hypothetical protein
MNEEENSDQREWDEYREEKKRKQKRADHLVAIGEPLPRIITEFYFGGATRFEFSDPVWDKDGKPFYPFGGTVCVRHSREEPDLWRVYWMSPFPEKGLLPLKGDDGWLINGVVKAIQLAREMQG